MSRIERNPAALSPYPRAMSSVKNIFGIVLNNKDAVGVFEDDVELFFKTGHAVDINENRVVSSCARKFVRQDFVLSGCRNKGSFA